MPRSLQTACATAVSAVLAVLFVACSAESVETAIVRGVTVDAAVWKQLEVDSWQSWLVPLYIEAVRHTSRLNREGLDSCSGRTTCSDKVRRLMKQLADVNVQDLADVADELEALAMRIRAAGLEEKESAPSLFDFPVFVMNLPARQDKRRHMECLMSSLGFSNVSFPMLTKGSALNFQELVSHGRVNADLLDTLQNENDQEVHRIGVHTAMAYMANALDQLEVIRRACEDGLPLFAIFEDDLVTSSSTENIKRTLENALQQLPPSADMLYLEACYEQCDASSFSEAKPQLMRLRCPSCSAAIIYTAKGAKRVLDSCLPVFHCIDVMFPKLIETQQLEAYLALPQPFFQDAFWGTDAMREIKQEDSDERRKQHAVFTPTCYESISWVLDDTELQDVAVFDRNEEIQGNKVRVMTLGKPQQPAEWGAQEGATVRYWTPSWDDMVQNNGRFSVEIAAWRAGSEFVGMRISQQSNCFEVNVGVCRMELVLEDEEGGELASVQRYVILDWGDLTPGAGSVSEWQSPLTL